MAKMRYFFFETLRRTGNGLFNFFSRCEERGVLPKAARWVKMSVLSAIVAGLGTMSAVSLLNCCYAPMESQPWIENASVTPNPTAGADTVTISARTFIQSAPLEFNVAKAVYVIENDTTDMLAVDGSFDSQDEDVTGKLYVGSLQPDTVTIKIAATNNEGEWGNSEEIELEITE